MGMGHEMTARASRVIAEFRGQGHRARYSIQQRRGNGWETVASHDDKEFAIMQAEGLSLTNHRAHRVLEWEWVAK